MHINPLQESPQKKMLTPPDTAICYRRSDLSIRVPSESGADCLRGGLPSAAVSGQCSAAQRRSIDGAQRNLPGGSRFRIPAAHNIRSRGVSRLLPRRLSPSQSSPEGQPSAAASRPRHDTSGKRPARLRTRHSDDPGKRSATQWKKELRRRGKATSRRGKSP